MEYLRLFCGFLFVVMLSDYCQPQKVGIGSGNNGNLRVCFVEGKHQYKKAGRFCPTLDKSNSGVECVIGSDRLDCLRRISKGSVDFGVFSSEDLLAARWKDVDLLVTDEMRYRDEPFEYQVVTIVDNESGINSLEDIRGSSFCHPGYGYEADWTDTLANYLETKIIPRSCDPDLTIFENKLKASASFFNGACKAGPWVADKTRDQALKSVYRSLCSLCYDPSRCSTGDKYWGRMGPLHCLTEQAGDIAWARYDDVKFHFGLSTSPGAAFGDPTKYSYLCSDGSKQPLFNNTSPCVWIAKPWPVIAAKRKSASLVSKISQELSHKRTSTWQSALLSVLESYHARVIPVYPQLTVQDYLQKAIGFQSANNYAECSPPRSIVVCTKSVIERSKCDWLAETAHAHGLQPQIQCHLPLQASSNINEDSCLKAVKNGEAEVAFANADWQVIAERAYDLEPILFEMTPIMNDLFVIVAVVLNTSSIKSFEDMKGKRACFPKYEGVAWYSVVHFMKKENLFEKTACPFEDEIAGFFDKACVPGLTNHESLTALCGASDEYHGEVGAFKCLVDGKADVAFVRMSTLKNITGIAGTESWTHNVHSEDYRMVCPKHNKNCYITWSSIGQTYIRLNTTATRRFELINTFKQIDQMYGKQYKSQSSTFSLYSPFDHKNNILFRDKTESLKTFEELANSRLSYNYELFVKERAIEICRTNTGRLLKSSLLYIFLSCFIHLSITYS